MNLALVESIESFQGFEQMCIQRGMRIEDFEILALDLRLQKFLKDRGVACVTTLKYLTNQDQADIVLYGNGLAARFDNCSAAVDRFGVNRAYIFEMKHRFGFIVNHAAWILCMLARARETSPSLAIYASAPGTGRPFASRDADSFTPEIAEAFCRSRGVSLVFWEVKRPAPAAAAAPAKSGMGLVYSLVRLAAKILRTRLVYIPDEGYGLSRVESRILRAVPRVCFVSTRSASGSLLARLIEFWNGLRRRHIYLRPLQHTRENLESVRLAEALRGCMDGILSGEVFRGVPVGPVLLRAAAHLPDHCGGIVSEIDAAVSLVRKLGVRLAIAPLARAGAYAIGELADRLRLRVLLISHGAHPVPADPIHESELIQLCQGFMLGEFTHAALANPTQEEHVKYFQGRIPWMKAKGIRTGPLLFSRVNRAGAAEAKAALGIPADAFVVTHAVTAKSRGVDRFHMIESRDEFVSSLGEIVRTVASIPDVWLAARIHPGFDLTPAELRALLPECERFIINNSGPFERVLSASDVLISFSSTTIDEALLNEVPVILFDLWKRYNHLRVAAFDGRAHALQYLTAVDELRTVLLLLKSSGGIPAAEFAPFRFADEYEPAFFSWIAESLEAA